IGFGGTIIRSIAQIAMPYVVAVATDRYIKTGNISGLTIIAFIYIGIALLMWTGQYVETINLSRAGQGMLLKLRTDMFDHIHMLSLSFFDNNKVGKIMSRAQNDVDQLQILLTQDVVVMVADGLTLAGIAVVMITMNAKLALITLAVIPVLVIVIAIWQRNARRAFIKVRRAISTVNDQLQEGVSGVRVTQNLSREEENLKQFNAANKAHMDANVEAARLQAFMMPIVEILTNVAYALVIVFGGFQVIAGTMGVGVLLGFLLYVQRFFSPVLELVMLYTDLQRSMASGARIFELLDVEPQIKDSPQALELPAIKGEIKFKQVEFAYNREIDVLHNISFTVKPGETVAIVGRTGAGKSSLTSLIARFYEADSGEILLDGYNITSVSQQSLRRQIGIVPQDPFLFSGSIEDNIRYGYPEASNQEVIDAAKAAGADNFISHLQYGYETQVGERGTNLSAGQRQLICLARAILINPPILILDEATSSVDTNTERIMQASLQNLAKGRTCIIIAHRLSTITNADRIIVLEHGKIIEIGSHKELIASQGLYYQMFKTLSALGNEQQSVN
ncbi:MAG: ABC transporter ATP-binding protein, partial [Chloroflexi bacterium]|nr:ABC transporter ATP-binding protein [Chloroflexota bacterium]